jgi:hypothetical protein
MLGLGHTATTLPDGRVVRVGGQGLTQDVTQVEIYNPVLGSWSSGGLL